MVTGHLEGHQTYLKWMVAASGLRPKDPIPLADGDDCSTEECSNEEEIPYPLAEKVAAQLLSLTVSLSASGLTSTISIDVKCPYPEPSLEALALKYIGCTKNEELLTSSGKEELLSAYGSAGKINQVCLHVFISSTLSYPDPQEYVPPNQWIYTYNFTFKELS